MPVRFGGRQTLRRLRNFPDNPRGLEFPDATSGEKGAFEAWRAVFKGSFAEYKIFKELERRGWRQDEEFSYQSPLLGGRQELGGAVVDFIIYITTPRLAIRVQGEYWHFNRGFDQRGEDIIQKERITNLGYDVVDILERDCLARPRHAVDMALIGQELHTEITA